MAYRSKVSFSYPIMDVLKASCAAYRINGKYDKFGSYDHETQTKTPANKELIYMALSTPDSITITQEDEVMAEEALRYMKSMTLKVIAGTKSGFVEALAEIGQKTEVTSPLEIGLIAAVPQSLENSAERSRQDAVLFNNARPIASTVGERIETDIEVVRCNFSKNWHIYFVTAVTNGRTVFFSFKREIASGTKLRIKGTVKEHFDNRTKLTRVKIVEEL